MRIYLYGTKARRMGFRQRMTGLIYVIQSLCNILTTIGMVTLLISLSTGKDLIIYSDRKELRTQVQLVCVCIITEWLDDCVIALITGYQIAICEGHINFWIAPCKQHSLPIPLTKLIALKDHAATIIRAFSPSWLQNKTFEFTLSGSSSDPKCKDLPPTTSAAYVAHGPPSDPKTSASTSSTSSSPQPL